MRKLSVLCKRNPEKELNTTIMAFLVSLLQIKPSPNIGSQNDCQTWCSWTQLSKVNVSMAWSKILRSSTCAYHNAMCCHVSVPAKGGHDIDVDLEIRQIKIPPKSLSSKLPNIILTNISGCMVGSDN